MSTYIQTDNDGNIISSANWKFPNSVLSDEPVERGHDGNLYKQSQLPVKPEEIIKEEIYQDFVSKIQKRLDGFAKTRSYDGILSLCSYATSKDAKFSAEGQLGVNLRDATWAKGYELLDEVKAGTRPIPTWEELEVLLPVLAWAE